MSLFNEAKLENAAEEVKVIFDEPLKPGMLPNDLRLCSVSSDEFKIQWGNVKNMFDESPEEKKLLTIIRYLSSNSNNPNYDIGLAGNELIQNFGFTKKTLLSMLEKPSSAPLDKKHKALLIFALKSISNNDDINALDIALLKKIGITEMEMFDIVRAANHMYLDNTLKLKQITKR